MSKNDEEFAKIGYLMLLIMLVHLSVFWLSVFLIFKSIVNDYIFGSIFGVSCIIIDSHFKTKALATVNKRYKECKKFSNKDDDD